MKEISLEAQSPLSFIVFICCFARVEGMSLQGEGAPNSFLQGLLIMLLSK